MSSIQTMFDNFLDYFGLKSENKQQSSQSPEPLMSRHDASLAAMAPFPPVISPVRPTVPVPTKPPVSVASAPASVVAAFPVSTLSIKNRMTGATVAFVNHSTVVTDAQIAELVKALQIQIDRDFTPVWKISADLVAIAKNEVPAPDNWVIAIMDTSDQAGALGYHDITSTGTPLGRVFAKDDIHYGLSWTVTVSHETIEMLIDPFCDNTVFNQLTNTTGTLLALEGCDACEDDSFGYEINGILVSDFVYPAWFEGFRTPNSTQFDHCNLIHKPFELLLGGYIGVFPVNPTTQGWNQLMASGTPGARALRKSPVSRTKRRGIATADEKG